MDSREVTANGQTYLMIMLDMLVTHLMLQQAHSRGASRCTCRAWIQSRNATDHIPDTVSVLGGPVGMAIGGAIGGAIGSVGGAVAVAIE